MLRCPIYACSRKEILVVVMLLRMSYRRSIVVLAVALLAMATLISGCATQTPYLHPARLDGPVSGYVALADAKASQVVAWWNASDFVAKNHEPTIALSDYRRNAEIGCWQEYSRWGHGEYRPVVIVYYHLTKPVGVLDGPNDLYYYVYMDTNEIK
jgi:hypothetical protein